MEELVSEDEMRGKLRLQGVVRSRLDLFEQRIFEGWTHQMLVDALKDEGIEITLSYFATCLFKARKERDAPGGKRRAGRNAPSVVQVGSTEKPAEGKNKGLNESKPPRGFNLERDVPDDEVF